MKSAAELVEMAKLVASGVGQEVGYKLALAVIDSLDGAEIVPMDKIKDSLSEYGVTLNGSWPDPRLLKSVEALRSIRYVLPRTPYPTPETNAFDLAEQALKEIGEI